MFNFTKIFNFREGFEMDFTCRCLTIMASYSFLSIRFVMSVETLNTQGGVFARTAASNIATGSRESFGRIACTLCGRDAGAWKGS
jgi:hypothetical protein